MMLSDGIEAASHTLSRPNRARIEEFVQKMIDVKVADGQLDECPLTLGDLKTLKDTFVRGLCGMMHSRIEYPEAHKDLARDASRLPALSPFGASTAAPHKGPPILHETSPSNALPPSGTLSDSQPRGALPIRRRALARAGRFRPAGGTRNGSAKSADRGASGLLDAAGDDPSASPGIAGSGSYS